MNAGAAEIPSYGPGVSGSGPLVNDYAHVRTLCEGSLDGLGAVPKGKDGGVQGVNRHRSSTWERVVVWPVVVGAHRDREP